MPIAAAVGLGMGIVSALFQYWLPPASIYTADLLSAVPFLVIAIVRDNVNRLAGSASRISVRV
jgi:hypothetical protein